MPALGGAYLVVIKVVGDLYERVFHEPMGTEVVRFLQNLSYVTIGTLAATVFSMTFNILAGRLLGPGGFGLFTLVQAIGMVLYLPMLAGTHASLIKYVSEREDLELRTGLISTTYLLVLALTLGSVAVYLLFAPAIAAIFSISPELLGLATLYAIFFILYTLTTSTLLGIHDMKGYAVFQPVFSVTMLVLLGVFYLWSPLSFREVLYAMLIGYGVTAGAILVHIRHYLSFSIRREMLTKLCPYALIALIGCITYVVYMNVGKLLINQYLSIEDVGIYGVYYYAAFTMITLFTTIFTTVLFPSASRYGDIGAIFSRVARGARYFLVLGVPVVLIAETVMLLLFGRQYPMIPWMMLVFAFTATIVNTYGLYQFLFGAEGVGGSLVILKNQILIAVLTVGLSYVLIPSFGIYGAIGGLGIAFAIGTILIHLRGHRYFAVQPIR